MRLDAIHVMQNNKSIIKLPKILGERKNLGFNGKT